MSEIETNIHLLIEIECFHILSEMCHSTIRFSEYYFIFTNKIYTKLTHPSHPSVQPVAAMNNYYFIYKLVLKFKDDCNLNEWRIRHSFNYSIVTSLIIE